MELMHGPAPDRSRALLNAGLECSSNVHYSNSEGVTHQRMCMADPRLRNDMQVSASRGVKTFGKDWQFSTPASKFMTGLCKDDEMKKMFDQLSGTDALRELKGSKPISTAFQAVPSLTALKEIIHFKIAEAFGQHGYIVLRQKFYDAADHEGFLNIKDAMAVFRNDCGVSEEDIDSTALSVWLAQLCTMKKQEVRASSLMTSLRPSLSQKTRRLVVDKFNSFAPENGTIKLGNWLSGLGDSELKTILITAFGGYDEAMVAETPITEPVFVELFSDLAPLADVEPLLL